MNALWQYWHPVLWSKEVADKPVPVKLLDQPLVIWRADENLSVFYDLCIHRGAALSLGWVSGDQLVCGYHGWNYADIRQAGLSPGQSARERRILGTQRPAGSNGESSHGCDQKMRARTEASGKSWIPRLQLDLRTAEADVNKLVKDEINKYSRFTPEDLGWKAQ